RPMHAVVGLVAYNLCFVAAGYGLLALVGRRGSLADAGLAYLLGLAALLIAMSALATWGYVAGRPVFIVAAAAFAVPALRPRRLASWRPQRLRRPRPADLALA